MVDIVKEIAGTFKFIKDFKEARAIFRKILGRRISGETLKRINIHGVYNEKGEMIVPASNCIMLNRGFHITMSNGLDMIIRNDYEVLQMGGIYLDIYSTCQLRKIQAQKYGKGYVDGLEEFLNNKTKTEIQLLREENKKQDDANIETEQ